MKQCKSKSIWKRVLCALLLGSLLLSAGAGCTQSTSSAPTSAPTVESDSSGSEETVQLKIFASLNAKSASTVTSYDEIASMQEIEKRTNVDVVWEHPPIGQEQDQFNLMVGSQVLSDIIFWNWASYPGGPEKAILDKVAIKLNDVMEQAPNLNKIYQIYPELYNQARTDEGTLYMFPSIAEASLTQENMVHNYWLGPVYRKDWAEELGIEEPKTIDDWYNMLTAFKNSEEGRIPFSATQKSTDGTSIYNFCAPFGVLHNFYMEDGKVNHGLLSPKFKTFVETMAKWYAEGLIDKDFLANDANSFKAKVTNGDVGAFIGSQGGNYVSFSKVMEETVPNAELQVVPWPAGADGVAYTAQGSVNHIVGGSGAVLTPANQNLEASIRYLDFGYSQEGIDLLNYGIEGVTYEREGDEITLVPDFQKQADEKGFDFVMGQYAFGGISGWSTVTAVPIYKLSRTYRGQYESSFIWGEASDALILPPITPTSEESTRIANIINQVTTYRDEMIGKLIMGQIPMSEYDNIVESAKKMGLEEAVDIQNAALERYRSR